MRGVDLTYDVQGSSVKESLILADATVPDSFTFMIDDPEHGLGRVVEIESGAYEFTGLTETGMAISLAAPMAWSLGEQDVAAPGDGSAWQRVTRTRGGYRVEVGLDESWAGSAKFPVVLDPTMEFSWAEGTLASAFGRTWFEESSESPDGMEEPLFPDCTTFESCAAMWTSDGSVFVKDEEAINAPWERRGYAAFVQMNLSTMPVRTPIVSAKLHFDADKIGINSPIPLFTVTPATMKLVAGDRVPVPDNWDSASGELAVEFRAARPVTDVSQGVEADVTSIIQHLVDEEAGDRAGVTIGAGWGCRFGAVCRTGNSAAPAGSVPGLKDGQRSTTGEFDNSYAGRWLRNPSLVIIHEGAVLPPPLPVDQTFGCACGEWGTGADAVAMDADPINTATGQPVEIAVDARLASAGGVLPWGRVFNGPDETDGPLGVGWTHPYNASLSETTNAAGVATATFRDPTGGRWRWTRAADGSYVPATGVTATLDATPGGGWSVTALTGRTITFGAQGRELTDVDRLGRGMTLGYSSGRLTSLTDTESGAITTLIYGTAGDSDGRIVEVNLPGGRSVSYDYTESAGEVRLTAVEDLTGEATGYGYDSTGALAGVTDPEGNTRAVNTYDSQGRIVTQAEPTSTTQDPHEWTFEWEDRSGGPDDAPEGTGVQVTTDPDGIETKQYYYGNVLYRMVDAVGGETDYIYDAAANLVGLKDPLGFVTTMTYDSRGNMLTRTSPAPESITETWSYNSDNLPTSYTNGAGETTTTTYTDGLPATVTDPEGGVTENTYNTAGQLIETTTPAGRTTEYAYDSAGNMTSETSPSGATTTWTYDAAGNQLTETTPRGHTTTFTYDAAGRVLTEIDPAGTLTTHTYDAAGRNVRTVVTAPDDTILRDTGSSHDAAGRVLAQQVFDRTVTTNYYSPAGRLDYSVDAEGGEFVYYYDDTGRSVGGGGHGQETWSSHDLAGRAAVREVNGVATIYEYDSAGRPVSSSTAGGTTETSYDDAGRPLTVTDPDGGVSTMTYDDNGRLLTHAAPGRQATTYTYDADGNRLIETSPTGMSTSTWTYTPDGQVASETSPRGNAPGATAADYTATYAYDADGNLTTRTDPLGHTWITRYDTLGRTAEVEDAAGRTTGYGYDRLGQLTTVTAPDDTDTTYAYDRYGNRSSQTDARDNTTAYSHNAVGQVLSETDPLNRTQTYTYNTDGNLETHTNARGQTTTYAYDWFSRVLSRTHEGIQEGLQEGIEDTYTYDHAGRLASFTDTTGTTQLAYNGRGLLTAVNGPGDDDYTYSYTPAGSVASRTYPSGAVIAYTYTPDGLTNTQEHGGRTTTYGWNLDQQLTKIVYPTSVDVTETRAVDPAGRVSSIQTSHTGTTAPILTIDYNRNPVGAPTTITRTRATGTPNSESFTYNTRDWLTRWCPEAATCTDTTPDSVDYVYDPVGNQTAVTGTGDVPDPGAITMAYDEADQRATTIRSGGTDPGTTTHAWDADGNLTGQGRDYDGLGRLTAAQTSTGDPVTYTYTALGHRRTVDVDGELTRWSWDLNNPLPMLAEATTGSDPTQIHDYTPDHWALSTTNEGSGGHTQWYTHDAQGTTTDTYTNTGDPATQRTYDPWGSIISDSRVTPGAPVPGFGYTSAVPDPGTGVWHLRARDYDPEHRAFISHDRFAWPAEVPAGTTYAYVGNQPGLYADPTGLCLGPDWICGVGSAIANGVATAADGVRDAAGGAVNGGATLLDLTAACVGPAQWATGVCSDYWQGGGARPAQWLSSQFTDLIGADAGSLCYAFGEFVGPPTAAGSKAALTAGRRLLQHLTNKLGTRAVTSSAVRSAAPSTFVRTEALSGRPSSRIVNEIADSMRAHGWQGDPIMVVDLKGQRIVVDGHHRLAAARRAGINVQYEVVDPSTVIGAGRWSSVDDILRDTYTVGPDRIR